MATPAIQLAPFASFQPDVLGSRLYDLIHGADGGEADPWITRDFPLTGRNYATRDLAISRVGQLARIANRSNGQRGFMAVVREGQVIGVLTFAQEKLERTSGRWMFKTTTTLVDGPLLACWLMRSTRRPGVRQHLLPLILREAAALLAHNGGLHGPPWTLVRNDREDHGHVSSYLTDVNNGFGGFRVEDLGEFPDVDGVAGLRKLFVGAYPIETLGN